MPDNQLKRVSSYDRLFDQSQTKNYNLSIRLNPDGLSFSVFSLSHKKYIAVESVYFPDSLPAQGSSLATSLYLDLVARVIDEKPWLLQKFNHKCVVYSTRRYTLVPEPLFNNSLAEEYLYFAHKKVEDEKILTCRINSAESQLVFGIETKIFKELHTWFPEMQLLPHLAALIESVVPAFKHTELSDPVFLNINNKQLDIIILKGNRLAFANSFEWRSSSDIVYFLLFVLDQLSLNPGKVPLFLLGETETGDEHYQLIYKYVRNVEFLKRTESYTRTYAMEVVKSHKYFDLLNPALCEL